MLPQMMRVLCVLPGLFLLIVGCGKQQPGLSFQLSKDNSSTGTTRTVRVPTIVSKERGYVEPLAAAISDRTCGDEKESRVGRK
jgi:hypothetical protein